MSHNLSQLTPADIFKMKAVIALESIPEYMGYPSAAVISSRMFNAIVSNLAADNEKGDDNGEYLCERDEKY